MEALGKMGFLSVMIEGGAEINASALQEGIVDKLLLFLAPILIGGKSTPTAVGGEGILAAVKAGRADAGGVTYFTALNLAEQSGGEVDVTDPSKLPEWTLNFVGIGFRKADAEFLGAFNEAQAKYLGSADMLTAVKEYGYTESQLPQGVTTEYACANR